jgi:parallel beta-helix repeat protein
MSNKTIYLSIIAFVTFCAPVVATDLGYKPGELIVRFAPKIDSKQRTPAERSEILSSICGASIEHSYKLVPDLTVVKLPAGMTVNDGLKTFNRIPGIMYAEPNYKIRLDSTFPNDPSFPQLWGLHNTGQSHPAEGGGNSSGTPDADIDAPEAWDIITHANDVIVAVIDTGVDYTHPDLAANMWVNEAELNGTTGLDDDGNGYIDDVYGYDFCNNDGDPKDDRFHGTHCAGIVGAVGNNSVGVTGTCWNVKIMAIKWLGMLGSGWIADAIEGIEYAVDMGAKVLSNSWGGGPYHQGLKDTIAAAGEQGVFFVAAAGNDGKNNDDSLDYPSSYDLDNIISVMATDHNDERSVWGPGSSSNWGQTSVDLAAPGSDILSTFPTYMTYAMSEYGFSTHYETIGGTSMAAPHVAGACALVWSANPGMNHWQVKEHILQSVDRLQSLESLCVSEGRLNLHNAFTYIPPFELSKEDSLEGSCLPTRGEIIYTINYKYIWNDPNDPNAPTSPGDPTEVKIIDFLPEEVTFDDWASDNGVYNEPNHAVVWNIGSLAPGGKGSVQLKARTNQRVLPARMIANWCKMRGKIGQYNYSETSKLSTAVCDCSRCGEVVYVDKDVAVPGDGASWQDAFSDLQTALAAAYPCDEVWVADGTYYRESIPADPNAAFVVPANLSVYGGFAGGESHRYERNWMENATILSGSAEPSDVNYVVRIGDPNAVIVSVLDGFVIQDASGPGVYTAGGLTVIQHNKFTNNIWGILCVHDAVAAIRNNWIYGNAEGIRLDGAGSETVIRNNTIVGNSGVGIRRISGSEPIITNCIIWGHADANDLQNCWATYSCIQDSNDPTPLPPYYNTNQNPLFVNQSIDDYHINLSSPCIDRGDPNNPYGPYFGESDIDHCQRIAGGRVDMGADEYCSNESSPADLYTEGTSLGKVRFEDYAVLADAWLTEPGENDPRDLNGDGQIYLQDLWVFAGSWLWQACWTTPLASEIDMMRQAGGESMMAGMGAAGEVIAEGGLAEETSAVFTEQESIDVDIDAIVDWLEGLWQQDAEIRQTMPEADWQTFIESVKSSAE